MINRSKIILVILLVASIFDSSAQNSQVLYYMNLPQRHLLNPALRSSNNVYIGLPVLSGVNVNINNNFVSFEDIFMRSTSGDSLISILHPDYDINRFLPKIKDINSIEMQGLVQLFGLGFNIGKDLNVFLDINERVEGNMALPGDLLRLGLLGNEQFKGSTVNLNSLGGGVRYYREAGFGFSKNFLDDLRIGVKAKLLYGIATASVVNNSLGITVNDDYSHFFDADLAVNVSAPLLYEENADGDIEGIDIDEDRFDTTREIIQYILSPMNFGLGLDIGAEYKITDQLAVSASITDLGYIKWKRDTKNIQAKSHFEFTGIDMLDVYNRDISLDSLAAELGDSLLNSFEFSDNSTPFTTTLPMGVTLGGSYNLTKSFSVGVLSYTKFVGKQIREALTVSANVNFGNALSATLAYTAANQRYDNLGAGLAFRAGFFQFYLLSDNIPVGLNRYKFTTEGGSGNHSIVLPSNLNTIHLRFGMNLVFGNRVEKKKDKPMVCTYDIYAEK